MNQYWQVHVHRFGLSSVMSSLGRCFMLILSGPVRYDVGKYQSLFSYMDEMKKYIFKTALVTNSCMHVFDVC